MTSRMSCVREEEEEEEEENEWEEEEEVPEEEILEAGSLGKARGRRGEGLGREACKVMLVKVWQAGVH